MNHAFEIWQTLVRATVDKKHPWRVVAFATQGEGGPNVRNVILRGAQADLNRLLVYTDRRSLKISETLAKPNIALLFWNPRSNSQLRIWATAHPETDAKVVDEKWSRIPEHARQDYATLSAPGEKLLNGKTGHDLDSARQNFVVLNLAVQRMELLVLSREGHTRVGMQLNSQGHWEEQALVP